MSILGKYQFPKSSCSVKSDMVLSFFCALAALIVAFWDQTCNPQMSTW